LRIPSREKHVSIPRSVLSLPRILKRSFYIPTLNAISWETFRSLFLLLYRLHKTLSPPESSKVQIKQGSDFNFNFQKNSAYCMNNIPPISDWFWCHISDVKFINKTWTESDCLCDSLQRDDDNGNLKSSPNLRSFDIKTNSTFEDANEPNFAPFMMFRRNHSFLMASFLPFLDNSKRNI
jgi:hypothetical protein